MNENQIPHESVNTVNKKIEYRIWNYSTSKIILGLNTMIWTILQPRDQKSVEISFIQIVVDP